MRLDNFFKICLIIFCVWLNSNNLLAQSYRFETEPYSDRSRIIAPSPPTASELGKYVEIPVALYTGIPSISVPLYQINENGYNLDISLSYHASGVKVKQKASWVGLGWSLNAGGVITRVVKGLADDLDTTYSQEAGIMLCPVGKLLIDPETNPTRLQDLESDEYFFSFNGISGSFHFDEDNNPRITNGSTLDIKVVDIDGWGITKFTITTDKGIKYTFSEREIVTSMPIIPNDADDPFYLCRDDLGNPDSDCAIFKLSWYSYVSSWYLSEIEFPDSNKKINFYYAKYKYFSIERSGQTKYLSYPPLVGPCDLACIHCVYYIRLMYPYSGTLIDGRYLSEIQWSGGIVKLDTLERDDIFKLHDGRTDYGYSGEEKCLKQITVSDKNNIVKKQFDLAYSYFESNEIDNTIYARHTNEFYAHLFKRLKLESVTEKSGNFTKPPYVFEYNEDGTLPFRYSPQRDFWGYYNANDASDMIPTTYVYEGLMSDPEKLKNSLFQSIFLPFEIPSLGEVESIPGANRNAASGEEGQVYMLKKIIYPTGGHDLFTFESNKFRIDDICFDGGFKQMDGGGMRIKQIDTYDPVGDLTMTKNYEYKDQNGNCSGRIMNFPLFAKHRQMWYPGDVPYPFLDRQNIIVSSNEMTALGRTQGSYVGYTNITVSYGENGRDEYTFDLPGTFGVKKDGIYTRSTALPYSDLLEPVYSRITNRYYDFMPFPSNPNYDWNRGQVLSKVTFNEDDQKVKEIINSYTIKDTIKSHMTSYTEHVVPGCSINGEEKYSSSNFRIFNDYYNLSGWKYLNKQEIYTYDPADESKYVKQTTIYDYNDTEYKQLSKTQKTESDGSILTTEIFYPQDYIEKPPFILSLYEKNITSAPIEVISYKEIGSNKRYVQGEINKYNEKGQPLESWAIENQTALTYISYSKNLSTASVFAFDTHYRKQISFQYNSSDKLVSSQKENDINHSYIWGYNNTYPIAKVENAVQEEVQFQNYEDGPSGAWINISNPYLSVDASESHTGQYSLRSISFSGCTPSCYYAIANNMYPSDLDLSKVYVFSGWVKADIMDNYIELQIKYQDGSGWHYSASILYNESKVGEWQYLERRIDLSQIPDLISIQLIARNVGTNGYSAYYDDFRFYPADAQMTTYTYDPLIGVTSITDPNNQSMHYDYDDFGRLIQVTDSDGHTIQEIEYNYADQ